MSQIPFITLTTKHSVVSSQLQHPRFDPELSLLSVEFCRFSLCLYEFHPNSVMYYHFPKYFGGWISNATLLLL